MVDVENNFLNKNFLNNLQQIIYSSEINWFWYPSMVSDKNGNKTKQDDQGYWYHNFYSDKEIKSTYFNDLILPFLKKLKVKLLYNVRLNCMFNPTGSKRVISDWHIDVGNKNSRTSIYYVNNNNGYTEIQADSIVSQKSVENTLISFPSLYKHRAIGQTDIARRMVINFNYIV